MTAYGEGTRGPAPADAGLAVVEYAATFPIAIIVILVCFQAFTAVGVVERVENAARTGARVAGQAQDATACPGAALGALPSWVEEPRAYGGAYGGGLYCHVAARVPVLWPGASLGFGVDRTVYMPVG